MSSTGVPTEIVVVGIGADGFSGLAPSSQSLVLGASVEITTGFAGSRAR